MARRSNRRRRGPAAGAGEARPQNGGQPNGSGAPQDRYQKFLPEWMKGTNGTPFRPPRPKRSRQPRPAGGYTPGKMAMPNPLDL